MKNIYPAIFLCLFSLTVMNCSKENIQKNILVDAITNGRWLVTEFTENASDYTPNFNVFEFQFYENGTVQAIEGSNITNGTWVADINTRTITASFSGTNLTLGKLNDTWKIINSTLTLVEANPVNTSRNAYLKLNKK
jgi:hypothetical protein